MSGFTEKNHIAFYIQQLLGTGHVQRSAAIVRAMHRAGLRVTVLLGGTTVEDRDRFDGAHVIQLPGIRATDTGFAGLMDATGQPVSAACWQARMNILSGLIDDDCPDAVMTELFPFGRRAFAPEIEAFLGLFRQSRPAGKIYCSLRDIIVPPKKAGRLAQSIDWARHWYDAILVHTDPAILPLSASLDMPQDLADRVVTTGYVVERKEVVALKDAWPVPPVLVASGGGAVGARLMDVALTARLNGCLDTQPWLFLVGRHLPEDVTARLYAAADDEQQIYVQPNRPDYRALLDICHVSVSQAGYNTLMDLVALGRKGVVVPFEGIADETEQRLRADIFARNGWVSVVTEVELSPDRLGNAIQQAAASPGHIRPLPAIDLDGADATARWVAQDLGGR